MALRTSARRRKKLLDEANEKILELLQSDARISYSDLARRIGLSTPAAIERVRKLEDAGIITGYHAQVDTKALGLPRLAVVRFSGTGPQLSALARRVSHMPHVLRAYRMSGDTCFLAMIAALSTEHLQTLLDEISAYGQATTSIVVSTPVEMRLLESKIIRPVPL